MIHRNLPPQGNSSSTPDYFDKAIPYACALGVILLIGGIFLTLAAHQILPSSPNQISQSGVTQLCNTMTVIGGALVTIGIVKKFLNWLNAPSLQEALCPNLAYRVVPLPKLTFTKQDVQYVISILRRELHNMTIQAQDCEKISALALLEKMNSIQSASGKLLDVDDCYTLCTAGLCAGLVQMQMLFQNASPEEVLENAQNNIKNILYLHIEDSLRPFLRYDLGPRATTYFNLRSKSEETNKLKQQIAVCIKQVFGVTYEEAFRSQLDGPLTEDQERLYKSFKYRINFEEFKKASLFHFGEDTISGRVNIVNKRNLRGHTLWFYYSSGVYYIQDSLNDNQGLFKFDNKDTFVRALYDQMQLYSEKCSANAYFWIQKLNDKDACTKPHFLRSCLNLRSQASSFKENE